MSTIDINSVAGFKAVDANGNELGIMSLADITAAVKESLMQDAAMARSVSTLSEASTLAATDTYEDQLPQQTDLKWARALDANGNPILISKQSLASVVGGLSRPLIFEATYRANVDVNNIRQNGFYYLTINITNAIAYSFLVVFSSKDVCFQFNAANDASFLKVRSMNDAGSWSDWKSIKFQ